MRNAFSIALLLVIAALAVAACGGGGSGDGEKPTVPSGAVAVVGDQTITQEQFDRLYESAVAQGEANGQKAPAAGSAEETTLKQQVLQALVQKIGRAHV